MGNFAERLKEIRLQKNLTQEAFATIAGVTKKSQLNYEKGERSPDADYLMRLAEEGLDVKYLLTGKHDRSKLNYIQGQLLDFYDKADDDSRAVVFDLFMIEQSGESAQQTLTYKQNVMEYLTGHRQYGELSQEEMALLHLWRKTPWHMRKAVLNMLATDWFEEEPKNDEAEDSSGGSSSQGGDSGGDSETVTASRRNKDGQSGEGGDPEVFFKAHRDKTNKPDPGKLFFRALMVVSVFLCASILYLHHLPTILTPPIITVMAILLLTVCFAMTAAYYALGVAIRNEWLLKSVHKWCRYNMSDQLWRKWRGDADGEGKKARAKIRLWHAFNRRETAKERYHENPTKRCKRKMEVQEARWQEKYRSFLAEYGFCAPVVN